MTKISFVTATARNDYPYDGRPDLHIFEPTIESLKAQTMLDFEWVIVDYLYEERKDYFKDKNLPFKVKHVPASPNIWHNYNLPGACTQYNKGIIYADGELLYFTGEGYIFIPEFCEKLWNYHKQGYIPLVWYFLDNTFTPTNEIYNQSENFKKAYPNNSESTPIPYNICGYIGKNITIEHRPLIAFKNNKQMYNATWEWYFGCSATSLEAALKINGYDQRFDGDHTLLDCDFGSRLQLAGYNKFSLFKDLFTARFKAVGNWAFGTERPSIKCNYGLIFLSRNLNEFRANTRKITDEDIKWIKESFCANTCLNGKYCRENHLWQYPFEHKEGYPGHNSQKKWFDYWRTHQVMINLTEERQKRLSGDKKYEIGTFT